MQDHPKFDTTNDMVRATYADLKGFSITDVSFKIKR